MGQKTPHDDHDAVPSVTWWLLNGTGKPPTWAQLERRAMASRRMEPSSSRKRGQKVNTGSSEEGGTEEGTTRDADDGGGGEEGPEANAAPKTNKAGSKAAGELGSRVQGGRTLRRLMGRFLKRPAKRPLPSHVENSVDEPPDTTQGHRD